jgi:hypothetical protein
VPFSTEVREETLIKSVRCCCVCHRFTGIKIEVHHIIQESKGGSNTIDNAIALCFDCHAEAGHYNPQHPRGTKYSPSELIKHRDNWWMACSKNDQIGLSVSENYKNEANAKYIGTPFQIIEKEIGTLWSHWANMPEYSEIIRFEGKLIGEANTEDINGPTWYELYLLRNGRYTVYKGHNHRGDWLIASLHGVNAWDEYDPPLTLEQVQEEYPVLAKKAGLVRVRNFGQLSL